jgi:hypothetical protein
MGSKGEQGGARGSREGAMGSKGEQGGARGEQGGARRERGESTGVNSMKRILGSSNGPHCKM